MQYFKPSAVIHCFIAIYNHMQLFNNNNNNDNKNNNNNNNNINPLRWHAVAVDL